MNVVNHESAPDESSAESERIAKVQEPPPRSAGVMRRLGAMVYDCLLVIAVMAVATVPFLPLLSRLHAKALVPDEVGWLAYVYRGWELLVVVLFFGFFWTRRGQTVGMQAWRLRLENEQGALLTWSQSIKRLALASLPWLPSLLLLTLAEHFNSSPLKWLGYGSLLLGFGALATLWLNPERRTWHDRLTQSRVVVSRKR